MNKLNLYQILLISIFVLNFSLNGIALEKDPIFDLSGNRSLETQYFSMRSEYLYYSVSGERLGKEIYSLQIKYTPAKIANKKGDEMTCIEFKIRLIGVEEVTLPSLTNWSYIYYPGINDSNQVFGVSHSKFENLSDMNGQPIPFDKAYQVFNAFIDFHSFLNVFSDPIPTGEGIQNLHKIGDKIIHEAAYSRVPVHLGKQCSKDSYFKNGEITLELKGQSVVNSKQCAIVGFDSGESSLRMIITPMPNFEVVTVGASHYKGDLYKDIKSKWLQKVTFDELVITETTVPGQPKNNSIIERFIILENITQK